MHKKQGFVQEGLQNSVPSRSLSEKLSKSYIESNTPINLLLLQRPNSLFCQYSTKNVSRKCLCQPSYCKCPCVVGFLLVVFKFSYNNSKHFLVKQVGQPNFCWIAKLVKVEIFIANYCHRICKQICPKAFRQKSIVVNKVFIFLVIINFTIFVIACVLASFVSVVFV